jgi:hypothetical protein
LSIHLSIYSARLGVTRSSQTRRKVELTRFNVTGRDETRPTESDS